MKVVTPKQMNEMDRLSIDHIGIPGIVLMENAALSVVNEILKTIGDAAGKKITIFAGKGNNGGDAFAVARHLYNICAEVFIYVTVSKNQITKDAAINLSILEKMGATVTELSDPSAAVPQIEESVLMDLQNNIKTSEIIIDGIFGTGLKGEVGGLSAKIIELINNSGKYVIAIDIPSGICAESGQVLGVGVKAHKTVTFAFPKIGEVIHPGCEYAGELIVSDIGIPRIISENIGIKIQTTEKMQVSALLPGRSKNTNKSDYGKALIITGSTGMTGAGCLTADACLRTGAGLVYLGVPSSLTAIYETAIMETITIPLEDRGLGYLGKNSISPLMDSLDKFNVIAAGPGLSMQTDVLEVIKAIITNCKVPLVLDADALNALSKDVSILENKKAEIIITPHPGEMSRLTGRSTREIQENRISIAEEFSSKYGVITVLKGSKTIIASPDGTIYINQTGNPGMATGGTGDVLTGIIAGLVGQDLKPFDASAVGVYLHGLAGDNVVKIKGIHGLKASDLVEELPHTILSILAKD